MSGAGGSSMSVHGGDRREESGGTTDAEGFDKMILRTFENVKNQYLLMEQWVRMREKVFWVVVALVAWVAGLEFLNPSGCCHIDIFQNPWVRIFIDLSVVTSTLYCF